MNERRRLIVAWSIVLGVGIAHRAMLFLLHRGDLDALTEANAGWYPFQYLPREMLRDHLARALLLLQQTPPVPNILMGLALDGFSWPAGVTRVLIGLQSLVSLLAAALLVHLLSVLYPRRVILWSVLGVLFVLSTDLVVMEYTRMGQTIYGHLSMLAVLAILDALVALRRTGRTHWAAAAGLATGLLVLTRATWYLFPVPCLLLVACLAPARRLRAVLACLVPIAVLQGGWALKNYAVYGVLSPVTSTWGGLHALTGLRTAGFGSEFEDFRAVQPPRTPLPTDARARDQAVEAAVGLANPFFNTLAVRLALAEDQEAFFRFAAAHPGSMVRKWWAAYRIFWQPIANDGRQFVALFATSNQIANPFDFPGIVRQLVAGTLPDVQYVMSGTHSVIPGPKEPRRLTPTTLYTLRWIDPFALMLELVATHLLLPLMGILWIAHRLRHGRPAPPLFDPLRMAALLVAATLFGYLAAAANLVETVENMRYRLEVEPVIWVITLICVTELAGLFRTRRASAALESAR